MSEKTPVARLGGSPLDPASGESTARSLDPPTEQANSQQRTGAIHCAMIGGSAEFWMQKYGFPSIHPAIRRMNLRADTENSVLITEFSPAESSVEL